MTTSSPMIVTTGSATQDQGRFAREALHAQRRRLAHLLTGLASDAWSAPSRCTEWSVHEVVRHLCDVTLKTTALLQGARPQDVDAQNVDPRTAPVGWLDRSVGEAPLHTLGVFEEATAELLGEVDRHLGGTGEDVEWLYGPVPWSIGVLHVVLGRLGPRA